MKKIIKDSVIGAMYIFFSTMFLAAIVISIYKAIGK
jgi:hypothetical protein